MKIHRDDKESPGVRSKRKGYAMYLSLPFGDYDDAIERRPGAKVCSGHFREFKGSKLALMV